MGEQLLIRPATCQCGSSADLRLVYEETFTHRVIGVDDNGRYIIQSDHDNGDTDNYRLECYNCGHASTSPLDYDYEDSVPELVMIDADPQEL